ncbi:MAG TPA: type II secretion system F family protein [Isosphaeraceae bacterium]|nr:type II secretion system F family protein [Isosphaeraceae bacterium]
MSRDLEGDKPPKPRRPRPAIDPGLVADRESPGDEYATYQPSPVGSTAGGKSRGSKKQGGVNPLAEKFEAPVGGPTWWERILFGSVSTGQLAQFCRQFGSYLQAGVDINKSLSSLERQFSGTALGPILGRIQISIRRGSTLEAAMAREPQAFGTMFLSMIKVAETRGGVPETLKMLARHYEARQRLLRQARSAMIYPVIVITVACVVVALITIFLLPIFAATLKEIAGNRPLPLPSQVLLGISGFVKYIGWWLIPLLMAGTPILLFNLYKTPPGKAIMDRLVLATPVFGTLCRKLDTSRFARTLSVLLDAGVDVGSSIDLTADVLRMTPIRQAVRSTREQIIEGKELSGVLDRTRQFSPDVIAVVETGEETGKLPETLAHLADDYDEQISTMVANLGHLVQPIMIVCLGAMVLFIILAVLMPIIQMISSLAAPG